MNEARREDSRIWAIRVPVGGEASAAPPDVAAWERLEAGRYLPRRFKGSFPGRELG